ncbi:hypothetical protein Tco_0744245 [Tanacetum coccineum]
MVTLDDVQTVSYLIASKGNKNGSTYSDLLEANVTRQRDCDEIPKDDMFLNLEVMEVRLRFSDPMIQTDRRDLPRISLVRGRSPLVVNLFTLKMESQLESISKQAHVAGNPVKKILLKLNLSDHRLCKMVVECQSVKVKEFQERCNIKAFQEWYEHVGPEVASPQGGKVARWCRDCAWLMISKGSRSLCQIQIQGTSSIQEVNDHYNIFTRERQEYELKTKDKA